jgi:hypothetical protein
VEGCPGDTYTEEAHQEEAHQEDHSVHQEEAHQEDHSAHQEEARQEEAPQCPFPLLQSLEEEDVTIN